MPPSRPEQVGRRFSMPLTTVRVRRRAGARTLFLPMHGSELISAAGAPTLPPWRPRQRAKTAWFLMSSRRATGAGLPVMVYIHGGGFTNGSGVLTAFSDRFVREQNVVLVGVNHRLGALGYTYLGAISEKYADSGNVGQLDLIAALEWVRDNIVNFGGDPENVTIFGESGGGAKISTLLAMPAAKGLFKRAIIESGSMLRVSDKESAAKLGKNLLDNCGLSEAQVDELQKLPLEKLMAASPAHGPGGIMRVGPVLDGRSIPQQTWDPTAPDVSADVAMIIGNCQDEATLFSVRPDRF